MNVWLIAAMSADGKIAQAEGQSSLDWTSKEDTRFFIDKTKEAGVVIMGRKTFDTIGKPLKDRRIIVMSRSPVLPLPKGELEGVAGTVEYTNLSPRDLLDQLAAQGVTTVAIAGGSSIYSQFLHDGLVTDLYLTIEPHLFGSGVPLATGFERIDMSLVDLTRLNDQAVLLHYKTYQTS
ncbi:MAG TPA: dihydrofolate reductase family protein [Patescibacteria group bacterium]|nr:dihydrofolate reductase family protein [Patescibacteria group bacterium]